MANSRVGLLSNVCSDHENAGEIEKIIERTDIMKLIKIQIVR
jgi:hypothetical protein